MSPTPHQVCCFAFRGGKGKRTNCSSQFGLSAVTVRICGYWVSPGMAHTCASMLLLISHLTVPYTH